MGRDPETSSERPRRAAKRGRRSDDGRRARLYLAELAWLEGFSDDDGWRSIATDDAVALDGARISKARRAARTVLREHPVALRDLVGDVDRWWQIVDAKLAWCSAWTTGKPAPVFDPGPYLGPRLLRVWSRLRAGRLATAANAFATAWVVEQRRVEVGLAWLAANEAELVPLAELAHVQEHGFERLVYALARLALSGDSGKAAAAREAGVVAAIALLAVDAPDADIALEVTRNVEARVLGQHQKPAPVPNRSGPRVARWLLTLANRDAATRQRALGLIAVAQIAEAIEPWRNWERAHAALIARATELAGHTFEARDRIVHVGRLVGKLMAARNDAPEVVSLADVIFEIDMLASPPFTRFQPAIVRLLSALPVSWPAHARARMLLHLARMAAMVDDGEHIEWLWDTLAEALESGAPDALLEAWRPAIRGPSRRLWLDQEIVGRTARRTDIQRCVRLHAQRAARGAVDESDVRSIATWIAAGLPDAVLLHVVSDLRESTTELEIDVARAVVTISDGTVRDIVAIALAMRDVVEALDWKEARTLVAFATYAPSAGIAWLVRGALAGNQRARLAEAAQLVMSVPAARRPRWREPTDIAWIARYPVALAPALRRLAMVDPDARTTAAKRLAADLPDPADLRREIAALRARGATGSTAKRLANLEQRLASPKLPSATRLANLADRIETTARDLGLSRLIAEATQLAGKSVVRAFGLPAWPEWAEPADRTRAGVLRDILFALLDLDSADRELAGRLLRARNGPPPWDLRDDAINRRFLDGMRAAKIDPMPWLDSTPRLMRASDGDQVSLALSGDPIDVFAMGSHFDTCLAPRGGNFFSVVANAADINKRVLYARRDGRVIGRCLFALTDAFAILVFQQYCHERLDFSAMVRDFALDLATRMGTSVAARGPVSTLLARDWYDDGARDLVGRFGGLDDSFDFAATPPDQLVPRLREALGRELDDVTLPVVLGHRSLRDQPRYLSPLVPFVLASNVAHTRIDAAQLALANGDLDLADRLLGDHGRAIRLDEHGWPRGEILARLRPSEILAALRRTRQRTVRRWSDERGDRIALAGVALEALARPRKAAAMYRLAAKRESWMVESMHEKLAALGEPVEGEIAD